MVSVENLSRSMQVYRQCRHALHTLSANIAPTPADPDGSPAILMVLSSERWPTFQEMFPGLGEDNVNAYGPAACLRLPGKHIEVINRCLAADEANFNAAVERFLGESFRDVWWWAENIAPPREGTRPALCDVDTLSLLSTALSASIKTAVDFGSLTAILMNCGCA